MVGINHAYVTKIGKLVGVVGLKEVSGSIQMIFMHFLSPIIFTLQLRKAIEDVNSGTLVVPEEITENSDKDKNPQEDSPLLTTNDQAQKNIITSIETDSIELDNGDPKKLNGKAT